MRIDCKHVWEHISAYIDGEVDAELRAEIDKHLETCEICSAVLDSTRNVVVLYADDRVFELPPDSASGCMSGWKKKWKCPVHSAKRNCLILFGRTADEGMGAFC